MFSNKEKLGLPPIFMGQSEIIKYHIPRIANDIPVIAYINDAIAKRVLLTPIIGSIP